METDPALRAKDWRGGQGWGSPPLGVRASSGSACLPMPSLGASFSLLTSELAALQTAASPQASPACFPRTWRPLRV